MRLIKKIQINNMKNIKSNNKRRRLNNNKEKVMQLHLNKYKLIKIQEKNI